jgi:NAD+ synthetase
MKTINYKYIVENIRKELKNYILKHNIKSLILGVSGGIDSAIVAALAKAVCDEMNIPLIGRSLSIETNKPDEVKRAREIGQYFCTDFKEEDLTPAYIALRDMLNTLEIADKNETTIQFKIRMGNIKARTRMIYLYNLAQKTSGMVLGTENKTEENVGFFTLGGDEMSDFEPIKGFWKTEVYDMAEYLSKNELDVNSAKALMECVNCVATDGLGITSSDLDQLIPDWKERHTNTRDGYREVDMILIEFMNFLELLSEDFKMKLYNNEMPEYFKLRFDKFKHPIITRHIRTSFKRNHPYIIKRENVI